MFCTFPFITRFPSVLFVFYPEYIIFACITHKILNMKTTYLLLPAVALSLSLQAQVQQPAYQIIGNDTTCQIFIYSPGEKSGLHVAYLTDDTKWHNVGQLCGSDYAQWGSEKKMYNPYVLHANDGTWRLIFGVNDYSPCFAASYSEDLVTWRPQDYPRLSQKGVF
jgi:hypothetical protein